MLVLGRHVGESIHIEGVGKILLCSARDGSARIGLEIDRRFNIAREELLSFTPAPPMAEQMEQAAA